MKFSRILFPASALILVGGLFYWFVLQSPYSSPEEALSAFYGGEPRPECMQTKPLRQHGASVVPLVIRDLPKKEMPRRRYAIGYLGEEGHVEALPTLEAIARDNSEKFYFRADALLAIYDISPTRAAALARQVAMEPQNPEDQYGHLKRITQDIENSSVRVNRQRCEY